MLFGVVTTTDLLTETHIQFMLDIVAAAEIFCPCVFMTFVQCLNEFFADYVKMSRTNIAGVGVLLTRVLLSKLLVHRERCEPLQVETRSK